MGHFTKPAIVIDNGSVTTKMGFAGSLEPHSQVMTAIGTKREATNTTKRRSTSGSHVTQQADVLVCDHATMIRHTSSHTFNPMIQKGLVQDWDALEQLWHVCMYDHLRCSPEEHPVLLSEHVSCTDASREMMAEIMFETFNVPGVSFYPSPILSLVASWGNAEGGLGDLSGTVVESGKNTTSVIPVYQGHFLRDHIRKMDIGGHDATSVVQQALRKNKRGVSPSHSFEVARQIKEDHGYVCSNFTKEAVRVVPERVGGVLPNGQPWFCEVDEEKYLAGEVLFRPALAKSTANNLLPLPELLDSTIQGCPIDCRRELYTSIVLSGGPTGVFGLDRRLRRDLKRIIASRSPFPAPSMPGTQLKVKVHPGQKHAAWVGGSIIASSDSFKTWCTTREQYEEQGPSAVNRNGAPRLA